MTTQLDQAVMDALAADMESFGGLMGAVLDWPGDEDSTLENLAMVARNHAGVFARKHGHVGFNFFIQNSQDQLLPGDFNPEKITSAEGRALAKRLMQGIVTDHAAKRYAVFAEVRTAGQQKPQVLVAAFEGNDSIGYLYSWDSMLGRTEPVPESVSTEVAGWWAGLLRVAH